MKWLSRIWDNSVKVKRFSTLMSMESAWPKKYEHQEWTQMQLSEVTSKVKVCGQTGRHKTIWAPAPFEHWGLLKHGKQNLKLEIYHNETIIIGYWGGIVIYAQVLRSDIVWLYECNIIPRKNDCIYRRTNPVPFLLYGWLLIRNPTNPFVYVTNVKRWSSKQANNIMH